MRWPPAAQTGLGKAAPGGSGPGSRERGGEGVSRGLVSELAAKFSPSSPAAPCGPRPAGPPAPSAVQAAVGPSASGTRTAGLWLRLRSRPGSAPGSWARERGVLGWVWGPPRPSLPPTPAVTRRRPSSSASVGVRSKGHGTATSSPALSDAATGNRQPTPRGGETNSLTRPIGAPKRHFRCLLPLGSQRASACTTLAPPPGQGFRAQTCGSPTGPSLGPVPFRK